jgi:aspartyl-tRNA synthetase
MFEQDEETGEWSAMHHPFTHPNPKDLDKLDTDPGAVKAIAYDIVLNGVELGGGSVRISDRHLQAKMFDVLGISKEDAERKFGWLLEAYRYGAPPHAGLAYGLDRLVMLLAGEDSIREVMAFPKNQAAQCMVCQAPSIQDNETLRELGLKIEK